MAGERNTAGAGGVRPTSTSAQTQQDPPVEPPENWWDIPGWYQYAQERAIEVLVPSETLQNDMKNQLHAAEIAKRKKEIAAKKARQAKWRAAHARQLAAKAAEQAEAEAEAIIASGAHYNDIFTTDPFTRKLGKFNLPTHKVSRSNSPLAFTGLSVDSNINYGVGIDANPTTTTQSGNLSTPSQSSVENSPQSYRRGLIYQDLDVANSLAGFDKYTSSLQLWGFQFMYNPYQIRIDTNVSSSIDHNNTADIANQLVGAQTISFDLLLNRVVDLAVNDSQEAFNSSIYKNREQYLTANYGTAISESELAMLHARGTEYDLEFLYRVINGDPTRTPMLKGLVSDSTADFGYLAGIPVWLRFNDNVKYKGVITGIGVDHRMFTSNMVPTLTAVSITFSRVPVLSYGNAEQQSAQVLKIINSKQSLFLKPSSESTE